MDTKIVFLCALICLGSCQQDEDDGSYNPEKYEKPYENLVDEASPDQSEPAAPALNAFTQSQPLQVPRQPQLQQPQLFQQPQRFQQPQPIQYQQPQVFPQQIPSVQQLQQNYPQPRPQTFPQPAQQVINPFPNNPFFQRLAAQQAPQQSQPQQPTFQQPTAFSQQPTAFSQQPTAFSQLQQIPQQPTFRQPVAPPQPIVSGGQVQTSTNYRTNDGHQRTESVDANGNVLGEYSYIDPNGKTITVKYSAGKEGFMVQGDHIPKSPEPQPQVQPQPQSAVRPQQPQLFQPPSQQFLQNSPTSRDQFQVRNAVQVPYTQEQPFNTDGSYNFQSGFQ